MTEPPDWVTSVPSTDSIHNEPARSFQPTQLSQDQLKVMRQKWIEQIIAIVVQALTGLFIPTGTIGGAEDQLNFWGNNIPPGNVSGLSGPSLAFDLQDTWNRFLRILLGNPTATDATPDDVETFIVQQSDAIYDTQNSTITLANLANAPKNVPFWVSPNPFEDVAFPRSQIFELGLTTTTAGPLIPITPKAALATGQLLLTTVRTTNNRVYNSIGFTTDGSTPPATVLAGLYKIDPATGDMTLAYNFGNISSGILTGVVANGQAYDTRIDTTLDLISNEGDLWAVAVLPIGGTLTVICIPKTTMTIPGVFPRFAACYVSGRSSLPATVDDSIQLDVTKRVWASVGQSVPVDISPITLIETFNSSDTVTWYSPSWFVFNDTNGKVGILNHTAYEDTAVVVNDAIMSSRLAKTLLHTDDQASQITMGSGPSTGNGPWTILSFNQVTDRAYVRCRNNGTAGAVLHLDGGAADNMRVRIATITGMNQIGTVRATNSGIVAANPGDRFKIEAIVTGGITTFTGYRNNVAIPGVQWIDTAGVVGSGKNWRSVGFGTGTYRDIFFGINPAGAIDQWTGYDIP